MKYLFKSIFEAECYQLYITHKIRVPWLVYGLLVPRSHHHILFDSDDLYITETADVTEPYASYPFLLLLFNRITLTCICCTLWFTSQTIYNRNLNNAKEKMKKLQHKWIRSNISTFGMFLIDRQRCLITMQSSLIKTSLEYLK